MGFVYARERIKLKQAELAQYAAAAAMGLRAERRSHDEPARVGAAYFQGRRTHTVAADWSSAAVRGARRAAASWVRE